MKKFSIKDRLIVYFVVLSVISITIVSLFSIFEAKKGITNRTFSQLILLRDLRKEQINSFFQSRNNELKSLATSEKIILLDDIVIKNEKEKLLRILKEEQHLLGLVSDTAYCKSLYFISSSGKAISIKSTADDQLKFTDVSDVLTDTSFVNAFRNYSVQYKELIFEQLGAQNSSRIFIASPLVDRTGSYRGGYLLLEILTEAINGIMYTNNPGRGMGETGEAYLVGDEGLMRSPSRFVPGAVLNIPVKTEGFLRAAAGEEGVGIYKDYRGIEVLGAYGSLDIGGVKRIILSEIDTDEAMVPLAAIRNEILFLSLIISLVMFSIAWFVAHGITRPIIRLKNAANFIARGNYDQQLEIKDNDEMGELTMAFNAMAREISSTTKDLRENEERLQHFYSATLDGIILHTDDRMMRFNSAMLDLTGYSEVEFAAFRVSDFIQVKKSQECVRDTEPRTFESVLIRKDGSDLPVEIQESCVDYDGKNIRASVIRDISARKKMEAELSAERNKRIRAVFDGQDLERQRLSRELHDGLGQQLVAGKLILESSLYATNTNELKPKISDAQQIFDRIISDIRRISHDLSPSVLHEFGLRAAMENLCNDISKASGIEVDFHFELNDKNPDEMTATYLYRIAQESLNNVHRHSGAGKVRVALRTDNYGILMEIEDNGKGFLLREVSKKGGNGLYNIRERVSILKGHLAVKSSPGKGTLITVRVPFNE